MKIDMENSIFRPKNVLFSPEGGSKKPEDREVHSESYTNGIQRSDPQQDRIKEIMDKAKRGQKLSADELNYLREKSPENYEKLRRAMMMRETLKQQMAAAKSQIEAERVYLSHMAAVEKTKDELTMGQLKGGHDEVVTSRDFKEKPVVGDEESGNVESGESKKKKRRANAAACPTGLLVKDPAQARPGSLIDIIK